MCALLADINHHLGTALLFAGIAWTLASRTPPRVAATAALTLSVDQVRVVIVRWSHRFRWKASTVRSEFDVIRSRSLNEEVAVKLRLASNAVALREAGAWLSRWPGILGSIPHVLSRVFPGMVERDLAYPRGLVSRSVRRAIPPGGLCDYLS